MFTIVLTIAAILLGILSTLVMIVFFLAGTANASPTAIMHTKWLMVSVVLVQVISLAAAIALLNAGRGWLACSAGVFPLPYAVVLVTMLVKLDS